MEARPVSSADLPALCSLVSRCRAHAAARAFPSTSDLPSLLVEESARSNARVWVDEGHRVVAWAFAQATFGNVLFDVDVESRRDGLDDQVLSTVCALLRGVGADSADTPLESDDAWRRAILVRHGFVDTQADVIHLSNENPSAHARASVPAGVELRSNAARSGSPRAFEPSGARTGFALCRALQPSWLIRRRYSGLHVPHCGSVAAYWGLGAPV